MSKTFIITGCTGYIGSHLVTSLLSKGHKVISLGNSVEGCESIPWRLGDELDYTLLNGVDAVIHLAHVWKDRGGVNYEGTLTLLDAFRKSSCKKFVFVSSISAKEDTSSSYGSQKWQIEQNLRNDNEVVVRVGLVYGGAPFGLWRTILKIVRFFPLLPMINPLLKIQPIHISELINGFTSIATIPALKKNLYVLGSPHPVTFKLFLQATSLAQFDRNIWIIQIPSNLIVMVITFLNFLGFNFNKDRLEGMLNLPVLENSKDLEELGLRICQPYIDDRFVQSRLDAEAVALLSYVGVYKVNPTALNVYKDAIQKYQNGYPLFLPTLIYKLNFLVPLIEPINKKSVSKDSFFSRVIVASMIAETIPSNGEQFYRFSRVSGPLSIISILCMIIKEVIIFPFRVIISWLR